MKKNNGITLIALIITIIVMVILVVVSVQILVNSGLIGKAKQAGEDTTSAYEHEQKLGENITINGVTYNSIEEYIGTSSEDDGINWEQVLAHAEKHPDQAPYNEDIGVGPDGNPVNLDLWNYEVINENEICIGDASGNRMCRREWI